MWCENLIKAQRENWSNLPPKLGAWIWILHKVVNWPSPKVQSRSQEYIKSVMAWKIHMKLGTLAHHVHGYKSLLQIFFSFCSGSKLWSFKVEKTAKIFYQTLQSTKGPMYVSYTVFHDPVGRSSERIHNQRKRDNGISSGRGGREGLAQCQGTQRSTLGRQKTKK